MINVSSITSTLLPVLIPTVGRFNRIMVKLPIVGELFVEISNKTIGSLLPKLTLLGFRKSASFEDAIWNWEIFLKLIGAQYDIIESTPDEQVYRVFKCPAGYNCLAHLKACLHTMALDHSLVKASGARLIVEKRIPVDGYCVERIVKA